MGALHTSSLPGTSRRLLTSGPERRHSTPAGTAGRAVAGRPACRKPRPRAVDAVHGRASYASAVHVSKEAAGVTLRADSG
eukprot:2546666-Prymnesium_polylepis.1